MSVGEIQPFKGKINFLVIISVQIVQKIVLLISSTL